MQKMSRLVMCFFVCVISVAIPSIYGILAGELDVYDEAVIEALAIEGAGTIDRIDENGVVIDDSLYGFAEGLRCYGLGRKVVSCGVLIPGDYVGYAFASMKKREVVVLKKFLKPEEAKE